MSSSNNNKGSEVNKVEEPFRLSQLFQRRYDDLDEEGVSSPDLPPTVQLWGISTSVALATGLIGGALRGARLGQARAMMHIKKMGIPERHAKQMTQSVMYRTAAQVSLRHGGSMFIFVGCMLGMDVLALQYKFLEGPLAPGLGAALGALLLTARRGTTACVSAVGLSSLMGLSLGVIRYGLQDQYNAMLKQMFPPRRNANKV